MAEGVIMAKEDRETLQKMMQKYGLNVLVANLETSRGTVARAIAGMGVNRATITHLRAKMGELGASS